MNKIKTAAEAKLLLAAMFSKKPIKEYLTFKNT